MATGVANAAVDPSAADHAGPYVVRAAPEGDVPCTRAYQPSLPDGRSNAITAVGDGYVLAGSGSMGDERPWAAHIDGHGTRHWTWGSDLPAPRGRQEAAWAALSTAPGWAGPFLAGGALGTLGTGLAAYWRRP